RVNMVIEAWTQESVRVKGEFYEAPFPFETGVEGYPAYEIARDAGAEGEIGPDGSVQRVCVVPKPYQQPHPPVFVAASKSQASIDYCARNGFIPTYFMPDKGVIEMTQYYQKVANENGFNVQLGQKQNLVRWPHVTKTSEDFDRKLREYDLDIYKNFYGPFFPQFPQGNDSELVQSMKDSQLFIGGTVDECVAGWKKIFDQAPCEYVTLIWHWAQQPKEDMMEELRLFMDEILPELEVPDFEDVSAAAE
ncbi:MAG: LLM class flavin-dependent oxidoreductase, partial [Rhodospirillaceae bacterium]|nr:LLM class flavin-dependent oxidoreductase [Rhodospirillaceae bacterium]